MLAKPAGAAAAPALGGGAIVDERASAPRSLPASAVSFAHASERQFARILDFYRVRWQYEPRSFPLREQDGRVVEMFTPDFYLPDLDLYLELTTLRQKLVTKKNRKIRLLKERHPELRIQLLYKRDYVELLAKYGVGPANTAPLPFIDPLLREAEGIRFTAEQVQQRVSELAAEITRRYEGREPIMVGALKGVSFFMADLIRRIPLPLAIDFLSLSRYRGGDAVRIMLDLAMDIRGRDVIVVEDIVDTGFTLSYLLRTLRERDPASLAVCVLVDKRARRLVDVPIDWVGFTVGDEFVVGYGLDYRQRYRNLPFLCVLRPEVYRGGSVDRAPVTTEEGVVGSDGVAQEGRTGAGQDKTQS